MSKRHGVWVNVSEQGGTSATSQHWPPSAAVSTCALVVSSEQTGQFHSVRGTDKIVLSDPKVSPQTAPVHSEPDQASVQSNKPRGQHSDTY
jgi:hypothetical protein